ncbi:MAG: ferritin-like domain-containing protein [Proteobacteria bacterium]|nr:ferritin-like domain-containing protein [Pseudomonadota bacterium]MCP4915496.1 ferritin-like domain-containing protein [Pseudomonadota bacterium]
MRRFRSMMPGRSAIPYGVLDQERTDREVAAARRLERIYHAGQERVWDGRGLLAELLEKHGGVHLDEPFAGAVGRVFSVIFWGELAAWQISVELAAQLDDIEAKMAATSQAHDEARHFYVLHDYLAALGHSPDQMPPRSARVLEEVLNARGLPHKLIGMQMMVEPMALTLFQSVREQKICPVLSEFLEYFERDEARHVALGINHLPALVNRMSVPARVELAAWQFRMVHREMGGLHELADDLRLLGLDPIEVLRLGQSKQLFVAELLTRELNWDVPVIGVINRSVEFRRALQYPGEGDHSDLPRALVRALHQAVLEPQVA